MTEEKKKPVKSFAVGGLSVALWENEADNGDGTKRKYRSVTMRRCFYNKKESCLDTQTIHVSPEEVGCMAELLKRMEEAVVNDGVPF